MQGAVHAGFSDLSKPYDRQSTVIVAGLWLKSDNVCRERSTFSSD